MTLKRFAFEREMESPTVLRVHPVVLVSILDAYERRGEQPEVIGVLMGLFYICYF